MARQWRIEYEGALYHVLSRGNERKAIVADDKDRLVFLDTLGQMSNRYDAEIHAYVLMDNHYHLLLKTNRPNLSRSMQWFGTTYTRRYNLRHVRSGHLFQGRFKNHLVEDESYLLRLSCYIHRNPLRVGILHRLVDYKWSSYRAYAYGKDAPWWLESSMILSQFKGGGKHKQYREVVQGYANEEKLVLEDIRHGLFLGSKAFVDRIKSKYLSDEPDNDMPRKAELLKAGDPREIIAEAAKVIGCDTNEFRNRSRIGKEDKEKRDLLLYFLWETGHYKGSEIGEVFGLRYSSVSRRGHMVRARLERDRVFKGKYEKFKSMIKL